MSKRKTTLYDMSNTKWGSLTVLSREGSISGKATWRCRCDCGNECVVSGDNLRNGHTKSCGCLQIYSAKYESAKIRAQKNPDMHYKAHGMSDTRLYNTWASLKDRCYCKNVSSYTNYGGRGITVCDEWYDFEPFQEWAMNHGYSDELTIDRIDNDGPYAPWNCRWIPFEKQATNKRNNIWYTENGVTMCIAEWCRVKNIPYSTIQHRRQRGWSLEMAFNTPKLR